MAHGIGLLGPNRNDVVAAVATTTTASAALLYGAYKVGGFILTHLPEVISNSQECLTDTACLGSVAKIGLGTAIVGTVALTAIYQHAINSVFGSGLHVSR